jgi:hypothetical protein
VWQSSRGCFGDRVGGIRPFSLAAFSLPFTADAPDDVRRHPPTQACVASCSGTGPIVVVVTAWGVDPS